MIIDFLRILATRKLKPLEFVNKKEEIDTSVDDIGIYIHIPFCETLCPFCPYNKMEFDYDLSLKYKEALIKEINYMGKYYSEKNITSVYFGGGTPSLMLGSLDEIMDALQKNFNIKGNIGIELHPKHIEKEMLNKLKNIGFDMVSIGVQSFNRENLNTLGREDLSKVDKLILAGNTGFKVIDVDLIFGIKGQSVENLMEDFKLAFENGATQVSTYPFIDFSYANNKEGTISEYEKKDMLKALENIGDELNLNRTSVWTFGKKGTEKYSSITRDSYIGFGAGAATLTNRYFKINTFSVEEYIKAINNTFDATSLTMKFTKRERALYWGFWNAYTLEFNRDVFRKLFNEDIDRFFRSEIFLGKKIGVIKASDSGYMLTEKGAYLYHLLEQHYTHQYIDKTWRICRENPWPEKLKIY